MCYNKGALAFILNGNEPSPAPSSPSSPASALTTSYHASSSLSPSSFDRTATLSGCDPENRTAEKRLPPSHALAIADLLSPAPRCQPRRRKVVGCQVPGCKSRALTRKLCMRHGGGSRCRFPGCQNGAKLRNLCFQHGGSSTCLMAGCQSVAKRFGYCWTHGGAYICSFESCSKFAAQGGLCWAHGGGNRCRIEGCAKRSYKQYDYRCKEHAKDLASQ